MQIHAMRRSRQALDRKECRQVLEKEKRAVLSVITPEGTPYGVPVNYVVHQDRIYIHCAREGLKAQSVAANPEVCLTVTEQGTILPGDWAYTVRSVMVFGTAAMIEEEDAKKEVLRLFAEKYFPDPAADGACIEKSWQKTGVLEIAPLHISGKRVHEK